MSTDWGIGCRDCAPPLDDRGYRSQYDDADNRICAAWFTGEWNNCRHIDELEKICAAATEIVALHDKLGDLLIVSWSGFVGDFGGECHDIADFFRAHAGHRLAPMDEYGTFFKEESSRSSEAR